MAKATGRNYLFDIPNYRKISIDAGFTGNESRFANHPSNGNANCSAKYIWSGDEKHIALYATGRIWRKSELFLNYGRNYWTGEMPVGDYGAERTSGQESEEEESEEQEYEDQSSEVEFVDDVEEHERWHSDESQDL
ncbi:unnamed protein product [Rhizoctonia solani]|uniref:SET domain-containing protein n=1 Tax=Rhizoctonia solani TaxID=456999 RepID=A0A8H3DY11_9AGAM|nr:unnamed protein product [Rhizoctonia solani]